MATTYTPTIGLEIHAELKTASKMFCDCINNPHDAEPNRNICPVCTAQPGTLPVVNAQAVEHVVMVGVAVGSTIATFTEFDRKNYFYPDIPKAYQISQYAFPLVAGGELAGVALTRIHLEEDTARNLHDQTEGSVVDYNRAGVPLMELVTEPVIHDAATAGTFARELQLLLRTLGVSDANMERGEMRVEANISVSPNEQFGTKVEVKNLNSFKSVEAAIAYEIARHIEVLESGGTIVQETRGWDENKGQTFSQRTKETAHDYRYFPDPDITKFDLSQDERFNISRITEKMPKMPAILRREYKDLGIANDTVEVIVSSQRLTRLMEATLTAMGEVEAGHAKLLANYVSSDVQSLLADSSDSREVCTSAPVVLAQLISMVAHKDINSRIAKDLLPEVIFSGADPAVIAAERGLMQDSSADTLAPMVDEIIAEHPTVVSDYKNGKESSIQFLIGQGMKKSKGAANPAVLKEVLEKKLAE